MNFGFWILDWRKRKRKREKKKGSEPQPCLRQVRLAESRQQFLADQFQAFFEAVVLKSQIEYQVFDSSRAKFFDLRGAVVWVADDQ